jgi:stage III sporulation protein AH
MVKRQTVWLSTMMVLSLMLIGYYTMNNDSTTTSTDTGSPSVSTSTQTPGSSDGTNPTLGNGGTGQTDGSSSASSSKDTSTGGSSTQTSADWYVSTQTQLDQDMAKKMDTQEQIITSNNASSDQLKAAETQYSQLQDLEGGIKSAQAMIVGKGYQDCLIEPSNSGKTIVYVKVAKLTNMQAVEIMNIVSLQLNVSAADVVVNPKA